MKVLVTGASGFLGRYLVRRLSTEHEVFAVGRQDVDLSDRACITALPVADAVCHLAAVVMPTAIDPLSAASVFRENVLATKHVADYSGHHGISRVIYTSSASVYLRPAQRIPVDETAKIAPASDYAASKLVGEEILAAAAMRHGFDCFVLRCSSIYGSGQKSGSVLPLFIERARRGEALIVQGTGVRSQDFVYAGDVAELIAACLASPLGGIRTYNAGSGEETNMLALAGEVARLFGAAVKHEAALPGALEDRFWLDIGRARKELGYIPRRISVGLRKIVK